MPAQPDYYAILQVSPDASPEAITASYRNLARKYHPDANPSAEADAKMKAINVAYDVLSDRNKRAGYDRQRATAARPPTQPAPKPASPPPPPPNPPPATPAQSPAQETSLFYRVMGWLMSPAVGVFVIAFIAAYLVITLLADAIAPALSEEGLVLLSLVAALVVSFFLRQPRE